MAFLKGHPAPKTAYKKGHIPWSKGKKGLWLGDGRTHFKKGLTPWNKGKKGMQVAWNKKEKIKIFCLQCGKEFLVPPCRKETAHFCSCRCRALWRKGEKSGNWKGGITSENHKFRTSIEYKLWQGAVFARDYWTCQKCQIKKRELHAHHIQNFLDYPELRFAIDNGITFCEKCHRLFHKKYGQSKNNKKQINEFLNLGELDVTVA